MKEQNKSRGTYRIVMAAAAVLAIAGFIVYLVNSSTGYMAGRGFNVMILAFSIAAVAGLAVVLFFGGKIGMVVTDLISYAAALLLIVSFALFVLDRVSIIADIYFLPVNYPAEEEVTLNVAIIGFVLYVLAIAAAAVAAFFDRE